MLNITEIKKHIANAIDIFNEYFDGFEAPKIVVVSASRRQAIRNKVLQECGVPYKEDVYGTDGEVIDGPLGKQILLYQSMMKRERQVCHALWHEFGHIMFGNEKQYNIDFAIDTPMRSGYAVLNETIAEYVAHYVSGGEGFGTYNPNMYLQMAFQEEGTINPYWLSRYMAIILGDNTVRDEFVTAGVNYVLPEVWTCIVEMFKMLNEQIKKDVFWKASEDFVEEFGELFDQMYHIVYIS